MSAILINMIWIFENLPCVRDPSQRIPDSNCIRRVPLIMHEAPNLSPPPFLFIVRHSNTMRTELSVCHFPLAGRTRKWCNWWLIWFSAETRVRKEDSPRTHETAPSWQNDMPPVTGHVSCLISLWHRLLFALSYPSPLCASATGAGVQYPLRFIICYI